MNAAERFLHSLRAYWHGPIPSDGLCVFRVLFGLTVSGEAMIWLRHAPELFSTQGFQVPRWFETALSPAAATGLCALLVLSTLCVAVGFQTRAAIYVTLCIQLYLYGVDTLNEKAVFSIILFVLFVLLFSDCSQQFSVDAYLNRKKQRQHDSRLICAFPLRLLQLHFVQIYFFAGVVKMMSPTWSSGYALLGILDDRWASPFGVWLTKVLPVTFFRMATLGTVLFELFIGVFLLLPQTRHAAILVAIAFHLGIQTTMTIESLGIHFLLALMFLFPDQERLAGVIRRWSLATRASRTVAPAQEAGPSAVSPAAERPTV